MDLMKITDYLLRAVDYIPFVSIAKGVYYIKKSNQLHATITKILNNITNKEVQSEYNQKDANALRQYAYIHEVKARAISARGFFACIPLIGNLFLAIHDIHGQFKGGYLDSMTEIAKLK